MVDAEEWRWITEHATGDVDHLLIGTSLPLIMGPAMHWLEAWNEVVADGAWGRASRRSPRSCARSSTSSTGRRSRTRSARMCDLLLEVGRRRAAARRRRRSACSRGDVHHAYLAEVGFPPGLRREVRASGRRSARRSAIRWTRNERRVILGCLDARRAGASPARSPARAGVRDPPVGWRLAHEKPWFNNQVAWLELDGRRATFVLDKAIPPEDGKGEPVLERVFERPIEPNADFARDLRHTLRAGVMIR